MAIFAPGYRDRHNRPRGKGKRSAIAVLSVTAMVDMFTVLAIFLLQNYNATGEVIQIKENVELPKASAVKNLLPTQVVVVSKEGISIEQEVLAPFSQVKEQHEWLIPSLQVRLQQRFQEIEEGTSMKKIKKAIDATRPDVGTPEDHRKVTVQADKSIDMLTIKKVMYTVQEAGATEINFAVVKDGGTPAVQ